MSATFLVMDIKDQNIIIELFDGCVYNGSSLYNHHNFLLYGKPVMVNNRGINEDEVHVMMSWSEYNVTAIGKVIGHLDENTRNILVYEEEYIKKLKENPLKKNLV